MSDETTPDESPLDSFRGPEAPVTTYMADAIVTIEASASLRQVASLIADASIGCVVVGSRDRVEAVISERDVVRAVADGLDLDAITAGEVGSRALVWASVSDSIGAVAEEMMEDYVRHVLVGENGGLVGIVSMRDVISAFTI
jgi:CBS domain-containing protein